MFARKTWVRVIDMILAVHLPYWFYRFNSAKTTAQKCDWLLYYILSG